MDFMRSAVGQINKLAGEHFFNPSAENQLCRRVREAKNQLCLALALALCDVVLSHDMM